MKTIWLGIPLLSLLALPEVAQDKEEDRVENAGKVFKEILDAPDSIPQDVLDKTKCVVILPSVLKFAIGIGGSYGRGVMTCRGGSNFRGPWGPPTMMALEGGSVGLQLGGNATDFVLLLMSDRSATSVLSSKPPAPGLLRSKVKIGADASAAAGPVGRAASAETDVTLRAEILSYSRARGLFAGISLEGSTIRPDNDANERIYGRKIPAKEIALSGTTRVPLSARQLISTLNAKTPKHKS